MFKAGNVNNVQSPLKAGVTIDSSIQGLRSGFKDGEAVLGDENDLVRLEYNTMNGDDDPTLQSVQPVSGRGGGNSSINTRSVLKGSNKKIPIKQGRRKRPIHDMLENI